MRRNGGTAVTGGGGAIVNLASGCSSFIAQPAFVPYSTTKGEVPLHQISLVYWELLVMSAGGAVVDLFMFGLYYSGVGMANTSLRRLPHTHGSFKRHRALVATRHGCHASTVCRNGHVTELDSPQD